MATQTLERRETTTLIGSDKVEGTNVYRSNGDKIGSIERIRVCTSPGLRRWRRKPTARRQTNWRPQLR